MDAGKAVLIVEMDYAARVTLRLALESAGYEVVSTTHWQGGLKLFSLVKNPALIFLDVTPSMINVDEFREVIKANRALAEIPIIVTSESLSPKELAWADAFMHKPLAPDLIRKTAHEHSHS